MNAERYFNFPVTLLKDFLIRSERVLIDISHYAVYSHSREFEYGTEVQKIKASSSYFNIVFSNNQQVFDNGKILFDGTRMKTPKVGINLSIFWDFNNNNKSDFEKVCLLGFLALKSILQQKAYCKITNAFWLARMDGKAKSCPFNELSEPMRKYANEYQTKKIKTELRLNWNLITYSRYTRGFYVSFKLDVDQLVYEAEKRRKSNKEKQLKALESEALEKALKRVK